eukprot:scaffold17205_cov186-Amphora_coffeaeformis.AAC.6
MKQFDLIQAVLTLLLLVVQPLMAFTTTTTATTTRSLLLARYDTRGIGGTIRPTLISLRRAETRLSSTNKDDDDDHYIDAVGRTRMPNTASRQALPTTLLLSNLQKAQTIAYRTFLVLLTAMYSLALLWPVLQDAGLQSSTTLPISFWGNVVVWTTVVATAVAPKTRDRHTIVTTIATTTANKAKAIIDGTVLASSVATAVSGQPLVGILALFLREMDYVGFAYKMEAAVGLVASTLVLLSGQRDETRMLVSEEVVVAAHIVLCLSLAILTFGKFLEPLAERLVDQPERIPGPRQDVNIT